MIEYLPFGEKSGQYLHSSKYCPLKPYIDENNLQEAVGLNYTQNQVGTSILFITT